MLLNCGAGEYSWESLRLQGDQAWIFIGRTDADAEAPILWPPDAKNWLIGKDPDAGKDWGQENGTTEDETVGWHHWLNGHEFEQTLEDSEGQGSLVCCESTGMQSWTQLNNWTTVTTTPERRSNIGRQPSWDNDGEDRLYFNCWHVSSHLLPNDIYTAERSMLVSCSFCTGVGAILKRRVLNGMHMFYNIQNELLILRSLSP